MIRRKKFEDEDDSPDRWLISYADFITLLFAFFVVMYAISTVNLNKYQALSNAVGSAFTGKNNSVNNHIKPSVPQEASAKTSVIKPLPLTYIYQEKYKREHDKMRAMGQTLSNTLAPLIEDNKVKLLQNQRGVKIDIQDTTLFESGSATLSPAAYPVIEHILQSLKTHQRLIQIEGHTDNTPIQNAKFDSNWELSALRATTVLRAMVNGGIDAHRLSAIALADTQPISTSDTLIGQANNRRVSIWILMDTLTDNPLKYDLNAEEIAPNNENAKPKLEENQNNTKIQAIESIGKN